MGDAAKPIRRAPLLEGTQVRDRTSESLACCPLIKIFRGRMVSEGFPMRIAPLDSAPATRR